VSATEVRARVEDLLDVDTVDVRCGDMTYPDVCSLSSQGECCWYLEWKIKQEPEQNESIYGYQVNGYSQADSSSHVLQNRNLFALNCDP